MSSGTCIGLAGVAGLFISVGYNVVSYAEHISSTTGTVFSGRCNLLLSAANIILSLTGIGIFVVSSKFGPVSVAMPVQTASNLLLNMIIQTTAGIKSYTKSMRVGTLVLATASVCLMDVGPVDPDEVVDVLELVSARLARGWLMAMLALLVASLMLLWQMGGRGTAGMLGYAVLVADSTALGATAGKMITVTEGWLRASCLLGYLLMGVGSLLGGLAAARACDIAVYLPTSQCIQLVINGLTGLFVWGDGERIQAPVSYAMVFILLLLGVYLCSELDLLFGVMQRRAAQTAVSQRAAAGRTRLVALQGVGEGGPREAAREAGPP